MLKHIDFESGQVKTEKYTYRIAESLSTDKYQEFLLIQHEVAYGMNFQETSVKLNEIYEALNKVDFVKASAIVHNMLTGIAKGIEKRNDPIMRMCCLFLIREDEDEGKYNEQLQKDKVTDLMGAGYDYRDFFQFAASVIPGLAADLNKIFQSTSQVMEGVPEKLKQNIFDNMK
ncbi:MAG: hypothetical protein PHU98_06140 [Mariniphaga sp.]|nr:hypothetical protein [Paludibacter sp.]MDD4225950.1 hypothetical protein [Mariniphaga sp.]